MSMDNEPLRAAAFPVQRYEGSWIDGMDLRDYLAAKALPIAWQAELAEMAHFNDHITDRDVGSTLVAKRAYAIAEAMLRARSA
jgi:hypothetical protein